MSDVNNTTITDTQYLVTGYSAPGASADGAWIVTSERGDRSGLGVLQQSGSIRIAGPAA
jgi:hypothetical protein